MSNTKQKEYDKLKQMDAGEVIDFINKYYNDYYEEESEKLEHRIENVENDKSEFDSKIPEERSEFRKKFVLSELSKKQKKLNRKTKKYSEVIELAKDAEYSLKTTARSSALLDIFSEYVDEIQNVEEPNLREIKKEDVILRAKRKDTKRLESKSRTITKKACEALKKYSSQIIFQIRWNLEPTLEEIMEKTRYHYDKKKSNKNDFTLLFESYYFKEYEKYRNSKYLLGIDYSTLREIDKILSTDSNHRYMLYTANSVGSSYDKYTILKEISEKVIDKKFKNSTKHLASEYEELLQLGNNLYMLELLLEAFENSEIKNSEEYLETLSICEKLRTNIDKRYQKLEEIYKNNNYEDIVKNYKKLEDLYRKVNYAKINYLENDVSSISYSKYLGDVVDYRNEMKYILEKYPELNQPKYNFVIENVIGKNNIIDIDPLLLSIESKEELHDIKNGIEIKAEPISISPIPIPIEKKVEEQKETKTPSIVVPEITPPKKHINDENLKEEIVVPENLKKYNDVYYPQYLEKRKNNPQFANLKYSEYLSLERPDLVELIELEQQREERVENIYKKYIKYRASIQDKRDALSFITFARYFYNLELNDEDMEYEEKSRSLN